MIAMKINSFSQENEENYIKKIIILTKRELEDDINWRWYYNNDDCLIKDTGTAMITNMALAYKIKMMRMMRMVISIMLKIIMMILESLSISQR